MRLFMTLIVVLAFINANAQEFKTFKAKQALKRYQSNLKKIEKLKIKADTQYKSDLKAAMKSAMQSSNLDEATLIKKVMDGDKIVKDDESKEIPVGKKSEEKIISEDKHTGSAGSRHLENVYSVKTYRVKKKRTYIRITISRGNSNSYGSVFLDSKKVGRWTPDTPAIFEIDITKHLRGVKLSKVEFKYKAGHDAITIMKVQVIIK